MTSSSNPARVWVYGLAAVFAVAIAADLLWMPIQVGDSLDEILDASRSPSIWTSFADATRNTHYFRPMRIAQSKALFDLASGEHYWLVYRGFHALLLVAAVMLFTRALRVSTAADFAAAAFALVVLTGLQTFRGTVHEAFPINHFLEVALACLLTLNLAQSRGGILVDVMAALTFVMAALTLESGLLVWVVAVAAWVMGWRGISNRGIMAMTVVLAVYLYVRFVHVAAAVPTLAERSTGYMLAVLDPPEIERRFGANPLSFYAYNVVASLGSVLVSEPQNGVFVGVQKWLAGAGWQPRVFVPVATSIATTALVGWVASRRVAPRLRMDDPLRLFAVSAAVLLASAALSYAYTKDDIMSTAGAFYALAAFAAMREALRGAIRLKPMARAGVLLLLGVLTVGWSIRSAGLHYALRSQATKHQLDWVSLPGERQRSGHWPQDPAQQRLIMRLRTEAIELRVPNTRTDAAPWVDRYWTE